MAEQSKTSNAFVTLLLNPISNSNLIMLIGMFVIGGLAVGIFGGNGQFLILLKDSEVSRGLITFLVALTTVSLAIILCLYVITGEKDEAVKTRFAFGKEVLTTLVGILGTVLGFYFGSADKTPPTPLSLAEIKFEGRQLITHVSGGTRPYRYSISSGEKSFPKIESRLSKDGWIMETLDKLPPAGTPITVEASDAKDKSVSLESKVPAKVPNEKSDQDGASAASKQPPAGPAGGK